MVPTIDLSATKPRDMWKHIAQRQPVVIQGVDGAFDKFTDDWLVKNAGNTTVMVERRSSAKGAYGQANKAPMQLQQLIKELQQGNTGLYMSTQEVGVGRDGHPLLCGPPLAQLGGQFPLQQPLMGHLVPQSVNMWMGCAPEGSSTGLHHDFHDNLYVLLRGCKRFRLYPPDAAPDMYVRGKLQRIYPNGRIVYEGQGDVLPDGSDKHDLHLWQARHEADEAAAAAAAADPSHAQEADDALEAQLELMLQEEDDFEGLADDYVDSEDDGPADVYSDDVSEESSDDGVQQQQRHAGKRKGLAGKKQQPQQPDRKRQKQTAAGAAAAKAAGNAAGPASVEPPPPSFSQVDLSLPEAALRRQFPRFPGVATAQEVLLQAGQMLYLPAGWFHEVTSFGGGGLDGGHLAINYWYHPPDNLDSSKAGFKQPYSSPYYPSIWAQRQPWLQQDTQRWLQHKQQHMQQQMGAAAGAAGSDGLPHHLRVKTQGAGDKKHVGWREEVHSPSNKYRMSTTREGTASGDASRAPDGSQPGNGPCCGTIGCLEPDAGSESDSPCSSRDAAVPDAAATGKAGKQQLHTASRLQQATHHADECTLRHVPGAADANGHAETSKRNADGKGASPQHAAADSEEKEEEEEEEKELKQLSEEVSTGIAALEDYFHDNLEALDKLLEDYVAQRRRRLAAAAAKASAAQVLSLPRLYGRRHHHFVAVRVVKRRPGLR